MKWYHYERHLKGKPTNLLGQIKVHSKPCIVSAWGKAWASGQTKWRVYEFNVIVYQISLKKLSIDFSSPELEWLQADLMLYGTAHRQTVINIVCRWHLLLNLYDHTGLLKSDEMLVLDRFSASRTDSVDKNWSKNFIKDQ